MSFSSVEEACEKFAAFATTLKPRIVKCQCGREDERDGMSLKLIPLDYQPRVRPI